jgi:hypothetical protein
MFLYRDVIQDRAGNTLGASVSVTLAGTATAASLYADKGGQTALPSNTVSTNSDGEFSFYIDAGAYDLTVTVGSAVEVVPGIIVGEGWAYNASAADPLVSRQGFAGSFVPTGTYTPAFSTATLMSVGAKSSISGAGESSILNINGTAVTATKTVFDVTGDSARVNDLAINLDVGAAGAGTTTIFATPSYHDFSLIGTRIDCGTVLNAGTQDRVTQIVKGGTTAGIEGTTLGLNHIENFGRVYTRDNANTAAHKRVKAFFNVLKKAWRTTYTFNAPSGSIEDVLVIGETFDTHEGTVQADSGVSGNHNAVGLVGVRGGRVIGNHITGPYGAIAHIEENTDGAIALGNTARMRNPASTDAALECLANNIGGSTVTPKHVAWIGNVLQSTDGVGKGAYLQSQASGEALHWGLVSGNVIDGFDEAYRTDTDARSVLVTGNVLKGVTNAAEMTRASLLFDRNVVQVAGEPIHVTRGGMIGMVHYVNLTSETGGITSFGASAGSPLVPTGLTWETGLSTIDTGTTALNLGPMPTRMWGRMFVAMTVNGSIHRHFGSDVKWDGATLTPTTTGAADFYYGSGVIDILPINNAGQLAIQTTNAGAAQASARIQVLFIGLFII